MMILQVLEDSMALYDGENSLMQKVSRMANVELKKLIMWYPEFIPDPNPNNCHITDVPLFVQLTKKVLPFYFI